MLAWRESFKRGGTLGISKGVDPRWHGVFWLLKWRLTFDLRVLGLRKWSCRWVDLTKNADGLGDALDLGVIDRGALDLGSLFVDYQHLEA